MTIVRRGSRGGRGSGSNLGGVKKGYLGHPKEGFVGLAKACFMRCNSTDKIPKEALNIESLVVSKNFFNILWE
jgi:hypothetical protein